MGIWVRFLGIAGLVLLSFGLLGSFLTGNFGISLLWVHIVLGFALIMIWAVLVGLRNIGETSAVMTGRTARFSVNAVVYAAVFLALLVFANVLVARHDKRWDLTVEGVYSLADQSQKLIKGLSQPLKIVALVGIGQQDDQAVKERIELYRYFNNEKVNVEFLDPRAKPQLLDTYEIKQGNLVYVAYGEKDKEQVVRLNENTEEAITNAILKLQRGESKKIYYVEGHHEPELDSLQPDGVGQLRAALTDEHLNVEGLLLAEKGKVPDDAACVLLISPKKSLPENEREILIKYVEGGGHLLMFHDPRATDDVRSIAAHFGIEVRKDVVIDQVQRLFQAPALGAQPVARTYGAHAITNDFTHTKITIFNIASSLSSTKSKDGATYTDLVKTGDTAWGEQNIEALFTDEPTVDKQPEDAKGPLSLAIAYEKKLKLGTNETDSEDTRPVARLVVFGDSDWMLNANIDVYANRDLVLNSVNWLAGEEAGISIRPRALAKSQAPMSQETFLLVLAASFLVPEVILLYGLMVWWKRRSLAVRV